MSELPCSDIGFKSAYMIAAANSHPLLVNGLLRHIE